MPRARSLRTALLGGSALADIGIAGASSRASHPVALLGAATALALIAPAHAQTAPVLPAGGVFVAGAGSIESSSNTMTITQTTGRGVIDWREFSIGAANQVQIDNASGATLNRVMSGQLSRIEGLLSATGSVYLMNPAGIIVGPEGRVTTGGDFVATTRQIDPAAFMTGGSLAIAGQSNGTIINEGSVVSQAGSVLMIAREVTNRGSITAPGGRVSLAAANEVLLATTDGKADGIYVSAGAGGGDITQAGRIEAAAVALQAANGNVFALAGNREGLVRATGTATIDGELWLTAPQGQVEVSGTLAAVDADGRGGRVVANGRDVTLAGTADISAAGTTGGEVLVGTSGFATGNDLAERTVIADGARIVAGGPDGGGLIETSGKALALGAATIVAGDGGKWLIDPDDLLIDAAAAATIVGSLDAGTDVTQQTTAGGSGGVGDITVAAPIVWTNIAGDLTLDAYRDIAVNAEISGGGDVTFFANGDIAIGAAVSGRTMYARSIGTTTIAVGGSFNGLQNVGIESANFVNQAGAGAVSSSGGNWFVASDDAANSSDGALVPDYYLYDYLNVPVVPQAGNGRFYRQAPSASFTLGPVIKDYDGTTDAVLDSSNVNMTGLVNGDAFTLDGSYATKDAGTGINVTASNFEANRGGIPVYNYNVSTPSVTAAVGTINPKALTALVVGNPTKTYNATTTVALTSANFALIGLVGSETITVNGAATSAYASADAGPRVVDATFATPNFSPGSGTLLTNYVLPTTATGLGTINPAPLIVSGVTANDKVYDGTTAATLNTGSASIFGVIPGDTVTLDGASASGTFATKNVGSAIPVTASGFILAGADASNYIVDQVPSLAANITPASLVVSGLVGNDKIYDGTTTASLDGSGVQFTGLISGDDVTPDDTGSQINFANKNAGTDIPITITGLTLDGADAGNYNLTYSGTLTADILQRQLTINATGMPTKVYDGTTSAVVGAGGITLDNVVAGESVTVSQAADVQYASKNVGVWDITGTLTPADYVAGAGTLLANYLLPTSAVTQGEITPAPLTIVIVQNPTKAYDGNANASLGPNNFAVSGFVMGEGAEVTRTSGQYASSDAGVWTISADLDAGDFDPDPGTLMSNYMIPSPVYGPGTITRIPLGPGVVTVDITGNPSKIYDGTTIATLIPSDYTLGGFLPGEGATITETQGTYDSKDAGFRAVLVLLDPSDFDPDPGTNLNNYTLPTEATGVGTIFQRMLAANIINNPTKVYNGTTRAVVAPADYDVTGEIAGESVNVAPGVVANYGSKDAGVRLITANFTSAANFTAGSGTLLANYVLPTSAQGPGTITPAPLLVLGVTAQNKVYDQTTVATLTGTASLFGVVSGDTVLLNGGSAAGVFAQSDVGNGIPVTVSGYGIAGADAGNYELFQPSGLNANITTRGLTIANVSAIDRLYDGTTDAQLDLGGASLVGVLSGDLVNLDSGGSAASFLQKDIGTDLRVNVGGFAISGTDSGNYTLSQPGGLTADINPVQLTGAILGTPTKTYDGTTSVSLNASHYSITGFIPGEGGTVTQSAGSSYDSADAGPRTVTATLVVSDITPDPGTLLSNYLLPAPLTGPGQINPAQLIASIINNPTKVYDATTAATLVSGNYLVQGFVSGQGATVTQTVGTYNQKNVGSRTVTANLASGDFTPNGGTNLGNYVLPTQAQGAGTITPAQLQVVGVDAEDKEYDGTTTATLINTGADLDLVLGSDTVVLVTSGASGTFATKNVGTNIVVTATGYTISGADAANYTLLQPTGVAADIFAKDISLASVTKVYDADTPVPTVNGAYTLAGVVAGDSVGVDASGIVGDYIDKNVGTGKSVTITSGIALNGSDAANYTIDPTVTNALIGTITSARLTVEDVAAVNRIYNQLTTVDLDNALTNLAGVLFDPAAGAIDDVTLVQPYPTAGTIQNPNAGLNKPVTVTGFAIQGADAGNYTLVQPDYVTVDIAPRPITLTSVVKVYDGSLVLPTDPAAYGFTGILSGDTVTANASVATGGYADRNVAGSLVGGVVTNGINVDVAGLILGGPHGANYTVADVTADPIGVITPRPLTVAIIGNPTKVYDGTVDYNLLTDANYEFTGFVFSEGATVSQVDGTFNSLNVDEATTITATINGFTTADPGTDLANYIVPTTASGPGTITPAQAQVINVFAVDKTYDGNTDADLDNLTGPAGLSGLVAADIGVVTLNTGSAAGTFASPNVGTNIAVTATGYALDGNTHGNYIILQPVGLAADITAKSISVDLITKIYDGGLALPTVSSAYTLGGVVSGDDVFVNTVGIAGAYADKNVATGILVSYTGLALGGTDASNYSISSTTANSPIGRIDPKTLTAAIIGTPSKTYNGLNTIVLDPSDYALTGFVGSESGTVTQTTGTFNSPDVVTATTITADLNGFITAGAGTDLANYILPTSASGAGVINPAALTAAIINNPTKTYDGNTDATLVSGNFELGGFFLTDGATVTQTAGIYDLKDAGSRSVTATLSAGDYAANPGTLLSNYVLPTTASGVGTIDPKALMAAIIGTPSKTYNGLGTIILDSSDYALTGFVGGESGTVTQTVGTFNSPDVVTATTITADINGFITAGSGTDLANYALPTSASGPGVINPAALTAAIINNPTKTYDGSTGATLTGTNFQLSGFFLTDGATITQTAGTYDLKDAGSRTVTATLSASDYTANPGTLLSNYALPTTASGAGTIDPKALTAAIINNPTKTYDGTTAATLVPSNYQLTGLIGGESIAVTQTAGIYASANAGPRLVMTTLAGSDFTAGSGTLLGNYILPTAASGAGTITQATLTAAIVGIPTKTYDGNASITLDQADYQLTGFVPGEGATVTETSGTFASPNAGLRVITATLDGSDFAPSGSTLLSNYVLPTSATGPGLIERALLTASVINNPTKVYDGTTVATLDSSNYQLTGFIAGQGATVTETVGSYASPNAGPRVVTVALGSADYVADPGTSLLNYVLPSSATGLGTIDRATLSAAIIGNPTKTYDGGVAATLTPINYQLTGFIGSEGATVTQAAGTYDGKDVGSHVVTASLTDPDFAPTGSTLLSNYILPTSASGQGAITRATLVAAIVGNPTRVYDGTTAATLTSANYQLTGFASGEGATVDQPDGTYGGKDAGIHTVTAALTAPDFTATGATLLSNYSLPTSASGVGTIDPATLAAIIVGNPTKTYDGTTAATLNSGNYQLTGFVGSEGATVSQTSGTYASADAGVRLVTASLGASDFTANSGTLLGNYVLPTSAAGLGTIDPKQLTAAIVNNPTKAYDGTSVASLTSTNFQLFGLVGSDAATVIETAGDYGSANVGVRLVSANLDGSDFVPIGSTLLANYLLPTSATGLGTIDPATLTAAIIGNPTKVYDGNAIARLDPPNFELTGFVAGEGASVTQAFGLYDSPNAGSRTVATLLGTGDFVANSGTLLSNYILPTSASGAGTIVPAPIVERLVGGGIVNNPTKVYDGNIVATLTPENFALDGFIGDDGAIVTQRFGIYASNPVGIKEVLALLGPEDFIPTGDTVLSNYILPTSARGPGTIVPARLAAAIVGNPTKVYDSNTDATLTSANYQLSGFVTGEGASVTQTFGTYNSPDVLSATTVTASLVDTDFTATGGTLLSNYILPNSASGAGTITPADLAVIILDAPVKPYDGTTAAELELDDVRLVGLIGDNQISIDAVIPGNYSGSNVGLHTVSVGPQNFLLRASPGTELSNYTLRSTANAIGRITPAPLTATLANISKAYDGKTAALLVPGNFVLSGFAAGEGASVTETAGLFASANVGQWQVTTSLDPADFVANSGTLFSNYLLPTSATGLGTINPAVLSAAIIGNPTKVYNGTAGATLGSGNYALTGFAAGEGASVAQTVGIYDSANAGSRTVTASLAPADFVASGGTLFSNYVLPTSAAGPGTINRADLTASITGYPTKPFDGTANATLTPEDYTLTGFISGEGATITQGSGTYAAPDVGKHQVTAALAPSDYTPDSGTLLSNYNLPTAAEGPGEITSVQPCAAIIDCFGPEFLLTFNRSHVRRFYFVYPSTFARYQAETHAMASLPSVLLPSSEVTTEDGWTFNTGTPILNSSEQVLPRGGGSVQIQIRYTPPLPPVALGVQP